jgi:purine-nucleoside phosphorylase
MSTAPEVVVARHTGMQVLGISCITNAATPGTEEQLSHKEVLETAEAAMPQFLALMRGIIEALQV